MTKNAFKRIMKFIKDKFDKTDLSTGLQRKNLLMNNFTSFTKNGVTAITNSNGSIKLTGSNNLNTDFVMIYNFQTGAGGGTTSSQYINNKKWLPNGDYILSGGTEGIRLQVRLATDPDSEGEVVATPLTSSEVMFTVNEEHKYVWCRLLIKADANFGNGITIYPMIRPTYCKNNTYESYIPSLQEQIDNTKNRIAADEYSIGLQRKNFLMNNCSDIIRNGITAKINNDGSITLNGKNNANGETMLYWNMQTGGNNGEASQYIDNKKWFPTGDFILSGGAVGAEIQLCMSIDNNTTSEIKSVTTGEVEININDNRRYVWSRIRILANASFNNVILRPMLRRADDKDNNYEQYIPDLKEQIDVLSTQISMNNYVGKGIELVSGQDLNELTEPGIYSTSTTAIAQSLVNSPYKDTGSTVRVEVIHLSGSTPRIQKIIPNKKAVEYCMRIYNTSSWGSWYKFSGTLVELTTSSQVSDSLFNAEDILL